MDAIEESGVFAPLLRSFFAGRGGGSQISVALEPGVDGTQLFDDCVALLRPHRESSVAQTTLVVLVLSEGLVPELRRAELDRLFKNSPRQNEAALWDVVLNAMGSRQILVAAVRCKPEVIGDLMTACMERASTERVAMTSKRGQFMTVAAVEGI